MESQVILVLTSIMAFVMCYSIGANDVSNSAATVIGAKILTMKQAMIAIGIAEFLGSTAGTAVSDTLRKKLLHSDVFADDPTELMAGFLAAVTGSSIWLIVAAKFGWPVSTTHSMIGAVFAFALVAHGAKAVVWMQMLRIGISWIVSPLCGALASTCMYTLCSMLILRRPNPAEAGFRWMWLIYFFCSLGLLIFVFHEVLLQWFHMANWVMWVFPFLGASLIAGVFHMNMRRLVAQLATMRVMSDDQLLDEGSPRLSKSLNRHGSQHAGLLGNMDEEDPEDDLGLVAVNNSGEIDHLANSGVVPPDVLVETDPECRPIRQAFVWLQIATSILVSFSHGMNDISNATGPFSAVLAIHQDKDVNSSRQMPKWILAVGGVALVIGLATLGYNVIRTVGTKLTQVTPITGFCMQFGTALTVMIASTMGLPVSTTHTLVGAITGLGLLRLGRRGVDTKVLRNILISWGITIPAAALPSLAVFMLFRNI